MPFSSAGLLQRLYSWIQDRDRGDKISAERMDKEFDNIVDAINAITAGRVKIKGQMQTEGGTEKRPGYGFYTDENTGMFQQKPNTLGLSTAGKQALTIDENQQIHLNQGFAGDLKTNGNLRTEGQITTNAIELETLKTNSLTSKNALYLAPSHSKNFHKLFLESGWTVFRSHTNNGWKFQNQTGQDSFLLRATGSMELYSGYGYIDFKKSPEKDFDYRFTADAPDGVSFAASAGNEMNLHLNAPQKRNNYIYFSTNGQFRWALGKDNNQHFYLHRYNTDGSYNGGVFQADYNTGDITVFKRLSLAGSTLHVRQNTSYSAILEHTAKTAQGNLLSLRTTGAEGPRIHYLKPNHVEWGSGIANENSDFLWLINTSATNYGDAKMRLSTDGHLWTEQTGFLRDYCVRDVRLSGRSIQKKIFNTWYTVGTIPYSTGSSGSGSSGSGSSGEIPIWKHPGGQNIP